MITHSKKLAFLENYPKFVYATRTAEAIGVNESSHYDWLRDDEDYKKAFQDVKKKVYTKRLEENEAEIHKRGLEKSDLLLIFETKALAPDMYREKQSIPTIVGDITIKMAIPPYDAPQLKEADAAQ